jgi:hypothetical protein
LRPSCASSLRPFADTPIRRYADTPLLSVPKKQNDTLRLQGRSTEYI